VYALFPSPESWRGVVKAVPEAHQFQRRRGVRDPLALLQVRQLQRQFHVLERSQNGNQVERRQDDVQDDLAEMFAKYHFRLIPVVDAQDTILGIIRYNDIMKGVETRIKI
jgi:CBS-domain-containing membrane protein